MGKSLSTSLLWRGVLAAAVGVVALAWPGVTVYTLVVLFAIYALIAAGTEAVRAFSSPTAGPVVGHLLLGLVDIGAAVIALAWPGPTALMLVLVVGAWATLGGLVEIYAGFRAGEPAEARALFLVSGLISIAFGVVLFARPDLGALSLALLFGLFNLVYGISVFMQGIDLRRAHHRLDSPIEARPGAGTDNSERSHGRVRSVV